VHNWNAGGSIVSAAVIRKQEDADKRMLVNRLHVKCSECKYAITWFYSQSSANAISRSRVSEMLPNAIELWMQQICISVLCHSCLRECDFANALPQTRCIPYIRMHGLMPVYSVK
jgi:hypothetical protein